jgi:hypothetical protein
MFFTKTKCWLMTHITNCWFKQILILKYPEIQNKLLEVALGRGYIVTNSNSIDPGMKKKTVGRNVLVGPTTIKFVTIIIIAVLSVVYLSQSTAGASRSLKIRDIEGTKTNLLLEKERLETEQTRLKSLQSIDSNVDKAGVETVSNVQYLGGQTDTSKTN